MSTIFTVQEIEEKHFIKALVDGTREIVTTGKSEGYKTDRSARMALKKLVNECEGCVLEDIEQLEKFLALTIEEETQTHKTIAREVVVEHDFSTLTDEQLQNRRLTLDHLHVFLLHPSDTSTPVDLAELDKIDAEGRAASQEYQRRQEVAVQSEAVEEVAAQYDGSNETEYDDTAIQVCDECHAVQECVCGSQDATPDAVTVQSEASVEATRW